jgi:uncharacterized protein
MEDNVIVDDIFQNLEAVVAQELACSAHDLAHVKRVYRLCLKLAADLPGVDFEILQAAALLHDIARVREDRDPTGAVDHAVLGAAMATEILRRNGFAESKLAAVAHCIESHRYRGDRRPETREAQVLFDADKLDVLGAIGIARSYILAGEYGEPLYSEAPLSDYIRENLTGGVATGRIKNISKHTANLEYELKLKLIPQRLHTPQARAIAAQRLAFMVEYFLRLRREIAGEA